MSSLLNEPGESQAVSSLALLPSKQKQKPQNRDTDLSKLTPLQQRKKDALELAELIYKIYNEDCPVSPNKAARRGKRNV